MTKRHLQAKYDKTDQTVKKPVKRVKQVLKKSFFDSKSLTLPKVHIYEYCLFLILFGLVFLYLTH